MTGTVIHTELKFSIDGVWLTDLVRQMYCYENNEMGALKILRNLEGITIDQATDVCEGLARLETNPDRTLQIINEKDYKFLKEYEKHKIWVVMVKRPREIKEEREFRRALEDVGGNDRSAIEAFRDVEDKIPSMRAVNYEVVIPKPSAETIRVGRWNVPKNYLDRYADYVVRRMRNNFNNPFMLMGRPDAIEEMASLEEERDKLHAEICYAVGISHLTSENLSKPRTKDEMEFDDALSDYLDQDEHAGKLIRIRKFIDKEESQGA
jgi:hypothetical protein